MRYDKLYETGAHTKGCCEQVGRDVNKYKYYNKPKQLQTSLEAGGDVDLADAGVMEERLVNMKQEMYMRTHINHLSIIALSARVVTWTSLVCVHILKWSSTQITCQ